MAYKSVVNYPIFIIQGSFDSQISPHFKMQFFFGKYAFMKECRLQNDKKKRKKYGKLQKKNRWSIIDYVALKCFLLNRLIFIENNAKNSMSLSLKAFEWEVADQIALMGLGPVFSMKYQGEVTQ